MGWIAGASTPLLCAAWSRDGRSIAAGGANGVVSVVDARSGLIDQRGAEHAAAVVSVGFAADGVLVSGGADGETRIWRDGAVQSGPTFSGEGQGLALSGKASALVTASPDGAARRYDLAGGQEQAVWRCASGRVRAVAAPTGRSRLFTLSDVGVLSAWRDAALVEVLDLGPGVFGLAAGPDGRRLLALRNGGLEIVMTDPLRRAGLHIPGHFRSAAFSPDGAWIATAGADGRARVWDAAAGVALSDVRHAAPVQHLAFAPNGKRLVTVGDDGDAVIWSLV